MSNQPEALVLADVLDDLHKYGGIAVDRQASLLRSQHARIEVLEKALRDLLDSELTVSDIVLIRKAREALEQP